MNTFGEYVIRVPKAASRTVRARAVSSSRGRSSRSSRRVGTRPSGGRGVRVVGPSDAAAGAGPAGDVGGGEGLAARRAPEALLEVVSARLVHQHGGGAAVAQVLVAPSHEGDQG